MASEYGWTDEQIGELPLARLRQITAAIQTRRYVSARQENSRFSWLARNVSGFIAAGYWVEKGKENKALKDASTLSFDDIEAASYGKATKKKPKENGFGSFERFMGMAAALDQRGRML